MMSFLAASALLRSFSGWMRYSRSADRPFFAYLALWEPHEPVDFWSPYRWRRLYTKSSGKKSPLPDGYRGVQRQLLSHRASLESLAPAVASGGGGCVWRLAQRNAPSIYYGAMSQVDASFGWMLAEFERQGVRDNTIVVLTSDNGPEHRELNSWGSSGGLRGAKGYVYEGGIRVPLLVQWRTAIPRSFIVDEPVHLWDLMPTICAAAAVTLPNDREIDGVSLLPLLLPGVSKCDGFAASEDQAAAADAAERRGRHIRTRSFVDMPPPPPFALPPPQPIPLPRPEATGIKHPCLTRQTPLFWAMHRGRGGMQYALRNGPWKLIGGCDACAQCCVMCTSRLSPVVC